MLESPKVTKKYTSFLWFIGLYLAALIGFAALIGLLKLIVFVLV